MISLGLGRLEVDWGKNHTFNNHSSLFMPGDKIVVPYHYIDDAGEPAIEQKLGFARPLRSVARRLDMLGYTLHGCQSRYDDMRADFVEHNDDYREYLVEHASSLLEHHVEPFVPSFSEYASMMSRLDVAAVSLPADDREDWDPGRYFPQAIMNDPEFLRLDPRLASIDRSDGAFFEAIDPRITLRLLAENPTNLDELVVWRFADVLDGGWIKEAQLYEGVPEEDVCLVVTEGSTDGTILRMSLPLIAPDLEDFFRFVDMSENYPFTGTGSLVNFVKGLARIRIQNRMLVVLDNDTAGRYAYDRVRELELPSRMRATTLPDLEECRAFPTTGPSGTQIEDINGRAVSIELFLDLSREEPAGSVVRWTSYNEQLDAYQGELVQKDAHTRGFIRAMKRRETYDLDKLTRLWNHLVIACTAARREDGF